ncbi:MAG TPA: AAA family ATPase [Candidatus Nanoarchaeia archaeon]|nr:AAA family ATPase [Candidatus Nanoarchaeia archaeon]
MAKANASENQNNRVVYSQANDVGQEEESKSLSYSIGRLEEENKNIAAALARLEQESAILRELFNNANNELNNLKKPSLLVADVVSIHGDKATIKLPNGNKFYCYIAQHVKDLKPGDAALVDQKSLNIVERFESNDNFEVEKFVIVDKPKESWDSIGGLSNAIIEVKEVIELPLKKPHLFEEVGIKPPKGILLYGPPGTGKTLLAKAVAQSTGATFIEVVGSELVQKFIGEGAKLVKDIFNLARRKAPSIIFIDEIDALAARRIETGTSGEREVSRTFMQLLAEIDGFKHLDNVKIVGATNRLDILDSAIIRPGRLDRLVEVGLPDEDGRLEILKVHTSNMNLKRVKLKEVAAGMGDFSGAEIQAVCTEAGYFAIRQERSFVTQEDFVKAVEKVAMGVYEDDSAEEGLFG